MDNNFPQFKIKTLNSSIAKVIKTLFPTHKCYDNPIQQNAKRPCWYINYYQPFEDKKEIDNMYTRTIYIDLIHEPEVYNADNMYDYYLDLAEKLNNDIETLTYNVKDTNGNIIKSLPLDIHDNNWTYDQSALHYKFKLMLRLKKEDENEVKNKIEKVFYHTNKKEEYSYLKQHEEYLYEIGYKELDYEFARNYLENMSSNIGLCSAIRKGNIFGKNFDWTYSKCLEFVVKTQGKYKSIGVAGGINEFTTDTILRGIPNYAYKVLPFLINDGINEKGVFVGMNVVPNGESSYTTPTTGTNSHLKTPLVNALMINRIILDNFDSADKAINYIANSTRVFCPHTDKVDEELHIMIGDEYFTYILEFVNNQAIILDKSNTKDKWITNFYNSCAERDENGNLIISSLTPHSSGTFRDKIINDNYDNINNAHDMALLLSNELKYTNSYKRTTNPFWYDEFCDGELTVDKAYNEQSAFEEVVNTAINAYENRTREIGQPHFGTWQTSHSSIYNIKKHTLDVIVQEKGINNVHLFSI